MRKRFCLLPALALALLCACSKGAAKTPPTRPADFTSTERQFNTPADGDTIAIFDTSLGEVRAVLYPDAAPMAVYNFVGLARSGYYDNTTIWRSEYGFAVQGGDATGTGTGGSTIWSNNPYPPEASADLKHYAGALCAAFAAGGKDLGHGGGDLVHAFFFDLRRDGGGNGLPGVAPGKPGAGIAIVNGKPFHGQAPLLCYIQVL